MRTGVGFTATGTVMSQEERVGAFVSGNSSASCGVRYRGDSNQLYERGQHRKPHDIRAATTHAEGATPLSHELSSIQLLSSSTVSMPTEHHSDSDIAQVSSDSVPESYRSLYGQYTVSEVEAPVATYFSAYE